MQTLQQYLKDVFQTHLSDIDSSLLVFETPPKPLMGDIAIPCFVFARLQKQSPQQCAQVIAERLNACADGRYTCQADGPYVNVFFTLAFLDAFGAQSVASTVGAGKLVLLEYSSPNANKGQHLWHLLNNLLGKSIERLLRHVGYQVVRATLYNDRGISICQAMMAYKYLANGATPQSEGIKSDIFVGGYYARYKELFALYGQERIEEETKEMLRQWEAGDSDVRALWKQLQQWVIAGYHQTYAELGCEFDVEYYESDLYESGREKVLEGYKNGVFQKRDDGALFIDLSDVGLDTKVVLRADGTSIYITQDIGVFFQKRADYNFDESIIITANEQNYHFQVLFEILRRLGFRDLMNNSMHLGHGYVTLPSGRMKSREGTVVYTDQLIADCREYARAEILARDADAAGDAEFEKKVSIIALSAVAFQFLSTHFATDIQFDPKEGVRFEGKTGPYMLYTVARLRSVVRRVRQTFPQLMSASVAVTPELQALLVSRDADRSLSTVLIALGGFESCVEEAALTKNPAALTNFLYALAKNATGVYHSFPVLGLCASDDALQQQAGVFLTTVFDRVASTLDEGLDLIGIETLESM